MERDFRAYLWDIQEATNRISDFVSDKTFEDYTSQVMLRSAVERQFEIIGEALNQLSKTDSTVFQHIPNARKIISFRNLLIHGYAAINDSMVWRVIHESLPELKSTVTRLLNESEH